MNYSSPKHSHKLSASHSSLDLSSSSLTTSFSGCLVFTTMWGFSRRHRGIPCFFSGAFDGSQNLIWRCHVFWWLCNQDVLFSFWSCPNSNCRFSVLPWAHPCFSIKCPQFSMKCGVLTALPYAGPCACGSWYAFQKKWIAHCKLLSCLHWCMEQPTCLKSSQLAFILADGESRKPLWVGKEAIFVHSVASVAKW